MPVPLSGLVRFAEFALDVRSRELHSAGTIVRVPDQSIEVLIALLEHPGELVTREQFRARLWPSNTFVDFEHGLNTAVRRLRVALGDAAATPRFIQTLPKRGYRFIGSIHPPGSASEIYRDPSPEVVIGPAGGDPKPADARSIGASDEDRPSSVSSSALLDRGATTQFGAPPWRVLALLLAAALFVAGLAIGGPRLWDGRDPSSIDSSVLLTRLTFDPGLQAQPGISPDGRSVVFSANTAGNFDIWTQADAGAPATPLTSDRAHDWQPDWSPDGRHIVFRSERNGGGLFVMGASGADVRRLTAFGFNPRWSPDGARIAFAEAVRAGHSLTLYVVNRDGGTPIRLTDAPLTPRERQAAFAWHPNARHLALMGGESPAPFWLLTIEMANRRVQRWHVADDVQRRFRQYRLSPRRNHTAAWDSETDTIYFVGASKGLLDVWSLKA